MQLNKRSKRYSYFGGNFTHGSTFYFPLGKYLKSLAKNTNRLKIVSLRRFLVSVLIGRALSPWPSHSPMIFVIFFDLPLRFSGQTIFRSSCQSKVKFFLQNKVQICLNIFLNYLQLFLHQIVQKLASLTSITRYFF